MYQRIKGLLEDDAVFYAFLVLLIGVTSFGLGRWSMTENSSQVQPASVQLTTQANTQERTVIDSEPRSTAEPTAVAAGNFVASKKGSKYHLPWCPGASQMNEENKIWFETKTAAEAAGYTKAANCKGL